VIYVGAYAMWIIGKRLKKRSVTGCECHLTIISVKLVFTTTVALQVALCLLRTCNKFAMRFLVLVDSAFGTRLL
jgi:hypothetical protein